MKNIHMMESQELSQQEKSLFEKMRTSTNSVIFSIITWLSVASTQTWCSRITVEAWEEAVKVHKPFLFWDGWIDKDPIKTWSDITWVSTDAIKLNMLPVQYPENFDDVMTSDNVPVDFSWYIKIKILEWKSPEIIQNIWKDWYENNIKEIFRTQLRDTIAKHNMTSLTTRQELLSVIQKDVIDYMKKFVSDKKYPIDIQEVILWKINPPDRIKEQLAETAAQQQRVKTEQEKTKAEVERKNSETQRAIADNAYRNSLGLTTEQFMQLQNLKTQKEVASVLSESKWNITIIMWWGVQPVLNVWK